jgi:hypothetical protein
MEAFANSIGLRALGLGAGVIDVLDGEIELVVVMLGVAADVRSRPRSPVPLRTPLGPVGVEAPELSNPFQ